MNEPNAVAVARRLLCAEDKYSLHYAEVARVCTALIAESDRARRLHEALRARVIDSRLCYECHTEQAFNAPERHAPGCLASPSNG